ncbi:MAG TPA: sigma 54-interacting transcriptional regulator [Syntrophales bacterium]|nr:sigma 54-interacting transcriptional regulator [Syntrophales bacterium]
MQDNDTQNGGQVKTDIHTAQIENLTLCYRLGAGFKDIIECLYDGIYITDDKSITIMVNSAYEKMTGIDSSELLGKDVRDLVKDGYFHESVSEMVRKKKERVSISQKYKTGKEVLTTGNPIFDNKGNIIMVVTNVRDMTDLNRLNRKLKHSHEIVSEYRKKIQVLQQESIISSNIIASSTDMQSVLDLADRVSKTDVDICIYGDTGVGKDRIAHFIHEQSHRSKTGILVKIDCGAIPDNLIESELFGYEEGAFTGAKKVGKIGLFELAHRGTVFLNEINSLPLSLQSKLLQFIQDHEFKRVGGTKSKKIDVRLICASNQDLKKLIQRNEFREDLYYRLNVVPIYIPPLKERREDIIPLCKEYMNVFSQKHSRHKVLTDDALNVLIGYSWPGNARELANTMERLVVTTQNTYIHSYDLPLEILHNIDIDDAETVFDLNDYLSTIEKAIIIKAIKKHGSARKAAPHIGLNHSTITRKLRKQPRGNMSTGDTL